MEACGTADLARRQSQGEAKIVQRPKVVTAAILAYRVWCTREECASATLASKPDVFGFSSCSIAVSAGMKTRA